MVTAKSRVSGVVLTGPLAPFREVFEVELIGQVLRHKSLQSTAIYARVDLERLRELGSPWPGAVSGPVESQ